MPAYEPEGIRFWRKVDKSGECWAWTAAISNGTGYGQFSRTGRRKVGAHRWSYEQAFGPIPAGHVIDHKCHNRACVRPGHLRAVSQAENTENHSGPTRASSTGIRGVYFETGTQRWVAQVKHRGQLVFFKRFSTIEAAAEAVIDARNAVFTYNDLDRTA